MTYTHDTIIKVLGADLIARHSRYRWPEPGVWTPEITADLVECNVGYHAARGPLQLLDWLDDGPHIYTLEYEGEVIDAGNKVYGRKARLLEPVTTWNKRTARLFACDCAEHVLHLFEARYPDDARPRQAIEVARRHANGKATDADLAAAEVAAGAAAQDAAWVAAEAAAGVAARATAWAAAGAAERQWQAERLLAYLNDETTELETTR